MSTTSAPDPRLRTPAAILAAGARLLAERGDIASMADVASAAGVGRATLYRYYPSRDALLDALAAEAVEEAGARIADAGLDRVPAEEAIERVVRALVAVGDRYSVLVLERVRCDPEKIERLIAEPMRRLFQRARDEGLLRDDVPLDIQLELFGGALKAGVALASERRLGREDAAAAVTSFYLEGARRR